MTKLRTTLIFITTTIVLLTYGKNFHTSSKPYVLTEPDSIVYYDSMNSIHVILFDNEQDLITLPKPYTVKMLGIRCPDTQIGRDFISICDTLSRINSSQMYMVFLLKLDKESYIIIQNWGYDLVNPSLYNIYGSYRNNGKDFIITYDSTKESQTLFHKLFYSTNDSIHIEFTKKIIKNQLTLYPDIVNRMECIIEDSSIVTLKYIRENKIK